MKMDDIRKNTHILSMLSDPSVDGSLKQAVCTKGPKSLILLLCGCGHNILCGACDLSEQDVNDLQPHRKFLYQLADLSQNVQQK